MFTVTVLALQMTFLIWNLAFTFPIPTASGQQPRPTPPSQSSRRRGSGTSAWGSGAITSKEEEEHVMHHWGMGAFIAFIIFMAILHRCLKWMERRRINRNLFKDVDIVNV